jgi:hypothetical protein
LLPAAGLPDGIPIFIPKIPIWEYFGGPWSGKGCFTAILFILRSFCIFCGHTEYFMVIWYIFPRFGMLHQEKSGNPAKHEV